MNVCSIELFNECAPYFEMLKDSQRQAILINLSKHKELSVSQIVELSKLSMPAVSHHLRLLSQCGLVESRKEGTKRYYKISLAEAIEKLDILLASLKELVGDDVAS